MVTRYLLLSVLMVRGHGHGLTLGIASRDRLLRGHPPAADERAWRLLDAHDHRLGSGQRRHPGLAEPRVAHPGATLRPGVVEAARGFDEHVEAHEQPERIP